MAKGASKKPSQSAAALSGTGVNLVNLAGCHPSDVYLKPPSASKFRRMRSSAYLRHTFALDGVQNCAVEQVKYSLQPDFNLILLFERARSIIALFLCSSFKVQVA